MLVATVLHVATFLAMAAAFRIMAPPSDGITGNGGVAMMTGGAIPDVAMRSATTAGHTALFALVDFGVLVCIGKRASSI